MTLLGLLNLNLTAMERRGMPMIASRRSWDSWPSTISDQPYKPNTRETVRRFTSVSSSPQVLRLPILTTGASVTSPRTATKYPPSARGTAHLWQRRVSVAMPMLKDVPALPNDGLRARK